MSVVGNMATVVSCFPTTINNNNRFSALAQHRHFHNCSYGGASFKDNTYLLGSLQNAGSRTKFRAYQSLWSRLAFKSESLSTTANAVMEAISSEEEFDAAISTAEEQSKPIVIDWMAQWCRKCIYLKPKLDKLASEFSSNAKFYYVDVNAVPQALVKQADVTKMPTIQIWKDGQKIDEVIGGHKAWMVVDEVREMLQKHVR